VVEALRWTDEDDIVLESLIQSDLPAILVVNKIDRIKRKDDLLPFFAEVSNKYKFLEIIPISARTGSTVPALEKSVLAALPEGVNFFPDDHLTDRSERFFAAELLREQLTQRYAKELPYALTVEIEKFEVDGKLYRIHALIWVERPGQKKIIIGNNGEALKEVASQARIEMEKFFDTKVFLKVWVKVKKSWSNDANALQKLGYGE